MVHAKSFLISPRLSKQQFSSHIIPHFPLAYLPIPFYNTDESIGSGRSAGAYVPVSPVSGLTLNIPGTHGGRCFSWKCIDIPKEEVLQYELQTSSSYYFRSFIHLQFFKRFLFRYGLGFLLWKWIPPPSGQRFWYVQTTSQLHSSVQAHWTAPLVPQNHEDIHVTPESFF